MHTISIVFVKNTGGQQSANEALPAVNSETKENAEKTCHGFANIYLDRMTPWSIRLNKYNYSGVPYFEEVNVGAIFHTDLIWSPINWTNYELFALIGYEYADCVCLLMHDLVKYFWWTNTKIAWYGDGGCLPELYPI